MVGSTIVVHTLGTVYLSIHLLSIYTIGIPGTETLHFLLCQHPSFYKGLQLLEPCLTLTTLGQSKLPNLIGYARVVEHVRRQRCLDVNHTECLCIVQELETIHSLATTSSLQRKERKVSTNHRTCNEVHSGVAAIAFGVVQVCKWAV